MRDSIRRVVFDRARRRPWTALAAATVVAAAAAVVPAWSQPPGGRGGPGAPGGMGMFDAPAGHMGAHIDRMLDGLGVTPAQRSQIRQIVMAAGADLKTQRDAGRSLHQRGIQIFTAPTVDAAAAESLRQDMETQHDQASRRVMNAMLDIAKVLTPEQRAKIGTRIQERQAIEQDRRQRMEQDHSSRHMPPGPLKP